MSSKPIPRLDARSLSRKQVQSALRIGKSLAGSDLRGMDLSGICFDGADLQNCKFAEANLSNTTFRKANLSQASLWRANLKNAVLDEATLSGADMEWCNLDGCTLQNASIIRTILPLQFVSQGQIHDAIRSGKRIRIRSTHGKFSK